MTRVPIEDMDMNTIPLSGLDNYTKEELYKIACLAMLKHDVGLIRVRFLLTDDATTKPELMKIIRRCNDWGTRA